WLPTAAAARPGAGCLRGGAARCGAAPASGGGLRSCSGERRRTAELLRRAAQEALELLRKATHTSAQICYGAEQATASSSGGRRRRPRVTPRGAPPVVGTGSRAVLLRRAAQRATGLLRRGYEAQEVAGA
ncbi:unnamed protein product, partial [Urochloa humidicola]